MTARKLREKWRGLYDLIFEVSDAADEATSRDETEREDIEAIRVMCSELIKVIEGD